MKDIKNILLGILAVLSYFILSNLQSLPFSLLGINLSSVPTIIKIIYSTVFEIFMISLLILILNKKIVKDFEDILKNHKEYYSKCIKYYLIGIMVMLLGNSIAMTATGGEIAGNEEAIRNLFKISPIYIYISSVVFAPIMEELVFRQGFRNIFGRNIVFILFSGIVFGGMHVIGNINTMADLLYLIPYSALGISFAYMLYKTDNIFVSMGFHFMHNGLLMALQVFILLFS